MQRALPFFILFEEANRSSICSVKNLTLIVEYKPVDVVPPILNTVHALDLHVDISAIVD